MAMPAQPSVCHLNHAGAGVMSADVLAAMTAHLVRETQIGAMEAANEAGDRLARCYDAVAALLNAQRCEIAFGTGHGALWGAIVGSIKLLPGDRILVSPQEWVGNLILLKRMAAASGATIEVMPSAEDSTVDPARLADILDDRVRIVSLTWVGASSPAINPAAQIGEQVRGSRAIYVVDASQAIGQLPIDVSAIGCDVLVACGRKFLGGPRGTGLAYVARRLFGKLEAACIDDFSVRWNGGAPLPRDDARMFETAEFAPALRLGLGQATADALSRPMTRTASIIAEKAAQLRRLLAEVAGVTVHDVGDRRAGLVTFSVDGCDCAVLKHSLARQGINVGANGPDYTPIDLARRGIGQLMRASVHRSTTEWDLQRLVRALDAHRRGKSIIGSSGDYA